MDKPSPKILVISSVSPSSGPAIIGEQIYEALKGKGLEVDLMTKYPEPEHPEYLWVVNKKNKFRNRLSEFVDSVRWKIVGGRPREADYYFFYTYEQWPPVASRKVVRAIKKKYDLVYIVFWQGLLSFDTIEKIYDRLHCLVLIQGVDYSHMSGGCHFTNNCERYQTGCGMCPAFHSVKLNDFTAKNVQFRKRVYEKIKPVVGGNLYMTEFYRKSYLLRDARLAMIDSPIINTDVFRPIDTIPLRSKYGIADDKEYIIFFGCQALNDERKGIKYLLEAWSILYRQMGKGANRVLVITAGKDYDKIKELIPFDSMGMGYVPMSQLPELYSLATLFVCPSVNDAGPMMVNQSLCCGTPVVGFDMGAVKQVVKDKGTGFCVPLRDSKALAEGMMKVFCLSAEEYKEMSERAREVAMQTSSYEAQANFILSTYEKYK